MRYQPEGFVSRRLFLFEAQRQRCGWRQVTKTDIGDIRIVGEIDPQHLMRTRAARRSRRPTADHTRGERLQSESDRPKCSFQQPVLLEAVPAALPVHEFVLNRGDIDAHPASEQHIDILECHRSGVVGDDRPQHRQRWFARSGIADALAIRVKVEVVVRHAPPPYGSFSSLVTPGKTSRVRSEMWCAPAKLPAKIRYPSQRRAVPHASL